MNAAQRQFAPPAPAAQLGRLVPLAAQLAAGVLLSFGLVVAVRRVAINQMTPVALPTTLATAVVLLLMAVAIRKAAAGQIYLWLPTALLAVWAVACSYPGLQAVAWLIWAGAIAADLFVARRWVVPASAANSHPLLTADTSDISADRSPVNADALHPAAQESAEPMGEAIEDGEVVLQHVVRVRDPQGHEYIHATLRGELAAGERRTTLYVGFCPPFPVLPNVEAEVIEGPPGVAKVVQALHNGVQVEVDLDEASLEPCVVTVEVAAYQTME